MTESIVDEPKPFPRIVPSLAWIILYLVLQIAWTLVAVVVVTVMNPAMVKGIKGGQAAMMTNPVFVQAVLWGLILSGVTMLGLMALNLRNENRPAQIGLFSPSRLDMTRTWGLGIALMLGALAFNWVYATYIIPGVELQDELKAMLKALSTGPFNIAMKFLTIAVMAPILEELLFRGYLQTALSRSMNHHAAIWLAAFIFGLIHFQPSALPALMVLGAAFGYLYHLTGSLKTNMALHIANNTLALMLT
jgi:uncharacterized protein